MIHHVSLTISRLKNPQTTSLFHPTSLTKKHKNNVVLNVTNHIRSPNGESVQLPSRLSSELMPNHVAVIMDGNRRWAKLKGLPSGSGYEAGVRSFRRIVDLCRCWGVKVETDLLMGLFERVMKDEIQRFMRENMRVSLIGSSTKLPATLQDLLAEAVETTRNNSGLHLIVAINYSGRADIVQACRKIVHKVKDGQVEPNDINELLVEKELETYCSDYPHPDLLIRTSGELRISNFLLWQLAYTELYFSSSLWPDFGETELLEAFCDFQKRQRRYGGQNS